MTTQTNVPTRTGTSFNPLVLTGVDNSVLTFTDFSPWLIQPGYLLQSGGF